MGAFVGLLQAKTKGWITPQQDLEVAYLIDAIGKTRMLTSCTSYCKTVKAIHRCYSKNYLAFNLSLREKHGLETCKMHTALVLPTTRFILCK